MARYDLLFGFSLTPPPQKKSLLSAANTAHNTQIFNEISPADTETKWYSTNKKKICHLSGGKQIHLVQYKRNIS